MHDGNFMAPCFSLFLSLTVLTTLSAAISYGCGWDPFELVVSSHIKSSVGDPVCSSQRSRR